MKTKDEVIAWVANYLYINGGASSKVRAQMTAEEIVTKLIAAGLLTVGEEVPA